MTEDSPGPAAGRAIHKLATAVVVLATLGIAGVLGAYLARKPIAESLIAEMLARQGIDRVSVSVRDLDASHIELQELHVASGGRLGAGRFELVTDIESASLDFTPERLLEGRLDSVILTGVRVRASSIASSPSAVVPADEASAAAGTPTSGAVGDTDDRIPAALWPLALPARTVRIADLHAELEAPGARATARGEVVLRAASEATGGGEIVGGEVAGWEVEYDVSILGDDFEFGDLELHRDLALSGSFRADAHSLEATLSEVVFDATLGGGDPVRIGGRSPSLTAAVMPGGATGHRIAIRSRGGDLRVPALNLAVEGIVVGAEFPLGAKPEALSLAIDRVVDAAGEARFPPLRIATEFELADERVSFEGRAVALQDRAVIDVLGFVEPPSQRGEIHAHLHELSFEPGILQPADLFPQLGNVLTHVSGRMEMLGEATFSAFETEAVIPALEVALNDVNLTTALSRIEKLDAVVRLDGPWPLSSPPRQVLSIGSLDVGVAVTDGLVWFELKKDGKIAIERAELVFAGGKLKTAGEVDLTADVQDLELFVEAVQLDALLERLDFEGLSGSGTLQGRIPLRRSAKTLEIHEGHLEAVGGGVIAYRPRPGVTDLAGGREEVNTALEAMSNFQYSELSLDLSGRTSGRMRLLLHVAGRNPDFYDGFPVEFNLDLESSLEDVLRQVAVSNSLVGVVEKNADDFRRRAANFRRRGASDAEQKAPR